MVGTRASKLDICPWFGPKSILYNSAVLTKRAFSLPAYQDFALVPLLVM